MTLVTFTRGLVLIGTVLKTYGKFLLFDISFLRNGVDKRKTLVKIIGSLNKLHI